MRMRSHSSYYSSLLTLDAGPAQQPVSHFLLLVLMPSFSTCLTLRGSGFMATEPGLVKVVHATETDNCPHMPKPRIKIWKNKMETLYPDKLRALEAEHLCCAVVDGEQCQGSKSSRGVCGAHVVYLSSEGPKMAIVPTCRTHNSEVREFVTDIDAAPSNPHDLCVWPTEKNGQAWSRDVGPGHLVGHGTLVYLWRRSRWLEIYAGHRHHAGWLRRCPPPWACFC